MDYPLISVIVPAYNAQLWLADCCQSVFSQSYPHWELIVVDDGSEDETLRVANEMAENRENVTVVHTVNKGVSHARNAGLDRAQGTYVTFLDADDTLMTNALDFLYQSIVEYDADIAVGKKVTITPNGSELPSFFPNELEIWSGTEGLEHSLEDHPATYAVWGKLYKKSLIDDVRFVVGKKIHEDSFFVFECLMKKPKVIVLNVPVLRYRLSENSASRAPFSERIFDISFFAQKKKELIEVHYPEFMPLTYNLMIKASMALLNNLMRAPGKKYREIEKSNIKLVQQYKAYFISAISWDTKMFFIITHHLYYPLKYAYRFKSFLSGRKTHK